MRTTVPPGRMRPLQGPKHRVIALLSALILALVGLLGLDQSAAPASAAAPDYTQSVTQLSPTQAQISFTPTTSAVYVDVHYLVNNANQQNVRMTNNAGTWT